MSKRCPKLKRKVASLLVSMSSGKNSFMDCLGGMPKWSWGRMGVAEYLGYRPKWFLPIRSPFYLLLHPGPGLLLKFPLQAKIFKADLGPLPYIYNHDPHLIAISNKKWQAFSLVIEFYCISGDRINNFKPFQYVLTCVTITL